MALDVITRSRAGRRSGASPAIGSDGGLEASDDAMTSSYSTARPSLDQPPSGRQSTQSSLASREDSARASDAANSRPPVPARRRYADTPDHASDLSGSRQSSRRRSVLLRGEASAGPSISTPPEALNRSSVRENGHDSFEDTEDSILSNHGTGQRDRRRPSSRLSPQLSYAGLGSSSRNDSRADDRLDGGFVRNSTRRARANALNSSSDRLSSEDQGTAKRRSSAHSSDPALASELSFPVRTSPLRSPMPLEFRASQHNTELRPRDADQSSVMTSSPLLPRKDSDGDALPASSSASSSRATRHSVIPDFDYDGRGGTGSSRISVDARSVQRHLGRAHPAQLAPRAEGETFADLRARKTSGSSSVSQRSGFSEPLAGGRGASLRRAPRGSHALDVFASEVPPMPDSTRSPKTSLTSTNSGSGLDEGLSRLRSGMESRQSDFIGRPASRGPSEASFRSNQLPRTSRLGQLNGRSTALGDRSNTSMETRPTEWRSTWRGRPAESPRAPLASAYELPLHAKNLSEVIEQFVHHYTTSTRALVDAGDSETLDMVQHMEEQANLAVGLNTGLRELLQSTLQAQIDAGLHDSAQLDAWAHVDRSLSSLLRSSDDQIRTLTSGLYSMMRADRERERIRRQLGSDAGSAGRPASRMSSVHTSPQKHGLLDRAQTFSSRTSPFVATRTESRLGREYPSRAGSRMDHAPLDSPLLAMDMPGSIRRLRTASNHNRSTSEATHSISSREPRRQGASTPLTLRAPAPLSPKRATLSLAAVSKGELSHLFEPEQGAETLSRRNTISEDSLGRSSRGTNLQLSRQESTSPSLSQTKVQPQTQSPVEESNALRLVSKSLSRATGRRVSRISERQRSSHED